MDGCEACDLTAGRRPVPGGPLHEADGWRVEHCVGPLGLGALVVKPLRHVTAVADLSGDEAAALGPLLRLASRVAGQLVDAEQVYNCLWSHAGGVPGHIHYVVQPVTRADMDRHGCHGPALQVAMFTSDAPPAAAEVERVGALARELFSAGSSGAS